MSEGRQIQQKLEAIFVEFEACANALQHADDEATKKALETHMNRLLADRYRLLRYPNARR